jgi:hypothetical protein
MNIKSAEISLCRIYLKSKANQKIDMDYTNRRDSFKDRLKNLKRQFPYDMELLCEKHGVKL